MTDTAADTAPADQHSAALAAKDAELAALGEQLAHMANTIIGTVPENFRALIPAQLSPAQQAAWVLEARKTGLFEKPTVPTTDNTKPTVTPRAADVSSLPPLARMAAGYAKH